MTPQQLWAPQAWLNGGWQPQVLLSPGSDGHWAQVQAHTPCPPDALRLPGAALPGLVNAHSHSFQRAFAGLAERRASASDDFWSWRDRMYGVALRIGPQALEAVATQLYAELLAGGYTQVCEFHYLQHAPDGQPYADPLTLAAALARAAHTTGIGLTLLPVLYQRAGFRQPSLRDDQRRFATSPASVLALRDGVRAWGLPRVNAGVAIHSLRAASAEAMAALLQGVGDDDAPIHLHIAEQTAEVDDCLAATGQRPIAWLLDHHRLDSRWQLVHATHANAAEIDGVAATGAGVVIAPSTEANLGDGLPDLPRWLRQRVMLSVGSDSQVGRSWPAELKLLDYAQRLVLRQRNVAAAPELGLDSTAARLFNRCLAGGAAAAGFGRWGLSAGARADLLVLDPAASGLAGVPPAQALDALVFATDAPAFAQVWVAGQCVVDGGRHRQSATIVPAFEAAMATLWSD
ncbi:MAG: formimidoylglutamate deiminase [Burkholderiales bacterium PBB5]|nr:MAG: formimidoylglutamate deiminase [Burkholderiales bacterium PBB5]